MASAVKVCIDATPIGVMTTDKGGVYRYVFHLIDRINRLDKTNTYTLLFNFFRDRHYPVFRDAVERLHLGEKFTVTHSRYPGVLRRLWDPPVEVLAGRCDVVHACFDRLRPALRAKRIVTVHDVRYLEESEHEFDPEWLDVLRRTAPSAEFHIKDCLGRTALFHTLRSTIADTVRKADLIITVSEYSKKALSEKLGVSGHPIKVIHHGVDRRFHPEDEESVRAVLARYRVTQPYVLYTGKFEPFKNILRLLEAFRDVARSVDVILVMAGPLNWFYYVVLEKCRELGIADRVRFTDFVADEEMAALYSGACAFALPTLYEGFGLPLLEAMACGVPIVTSGVCSVPEVVGEAAVFVDPLSTASIADGILRCMHDTALRRHLIFEGIERAKSFTWEETAARTVQAYREACGQ